MATLHSLTSWVQCCIIFESWSRLPAAVKVTLLSEDKLNPLDSNYLLFYNLFTTNPKPTQWFPTDAPWVTESSSLTCGTIYPRVLF